jgi:hypothetical protein
MPGPPLLASFPRFSASNAPSLVRDCGPEAVAEALEKARAAFILRSGKESCDTIDTPADETESTCPDDDEPSTGSDDWWSI